MTAAEFVVSVLAAAAEAAEFVALAAAAAAAAADVVGVAVAAGAPCPGTDGYTHTPRRASHCKESHPVLRLLGSRDLHFCLFYSVVILFCFHM